MGACCVARDKNEFEPLFDDFFNNMSFTNMNIDNFYKFVIDNTNNKNIFFNADEQEFLKQFVDNYVVNGKNKDPEWITQAKFFFHLEFKEAKDKGFFNFLAIILMLCHDFNTKPSFVIDLAKRFNIEVKNDREISKTAFESLMQAYIKFVSYDTLIFIGELTKKKDELLNFFTYYFTETNENIVLQNLISDYKNEETVDFIEFTQKNYFKLNHSEIRIRLIESTSDRIKKR